MEKVYESILDIKINEVSEGDILLFKKDCSWDRISKIKVIFKDEKNNVIIFKKFEDLFSYTIMINNKLILRGTISRLLRLNHESLLELENGKYIFTINCDKNIANNTIVVNKLLYIRVGKINYEVEFNRDPITCEFQFNYVLDKFNCKDENFLSTNKALSYDTNVFMKNLELSKNLLVNKFKFYSERSFNKVISPIKVEQVEIYFNPIVIQNKYGHVMIKNEHLVNIELKSLLNYFKERRYKKIYLNPITGKTDSNVVEVIYEREGFKLCKNTSNTISIFNFETKFTLFNYKYGFWFPCVNEEECEKIEKEYEMFKKLCE